MKISVYFFLALVTLFGCEKQSNLSADFNCSSSKIENSSQILDFNKNFKVDIPADWKTDLYYDNYVSEIFTADTIKQLTETFILDVSFNSGEVNFDQDFLSENDSIVASKSYTIIKSKTSKFQNKECFWHVVKGTKNSFPYHQFNLTVKLSNNTYFNAYVDVYGSDNVDERICGAVSIIDTVNFLQ